MSGVSRGPKETNSLKYKRFYLLWILLTGTLIVIISWPSNSRKNLENDVYSSEIKKKSAEIKSLFVKKIDLNRANSSQLTEIRGIGPVLTQRIISDRETHGPYKKVEELLRVKGIGPKKLAKIREQVVIGSPLESSP